MYNYKLSNDRWHLQDQDSRWGLVYDLAALDKYDEHPSDDIDNLP